MQQGWALERRPVAREWGWGEGSYKTLPLQQGYGGVGGGNLLGAGNFFAKARPKKIPDSRARAHQKIPPRDFFFWLT